MSQPFLIRLAKRAAGWIVGAPIAIIHVAGSRLRSGAEGLVPHTKLLSGSAVLAIIALSQGPAFALPQCMLKIEKTAFDVRALQSQMMIAGLTCGQNEEYNIFVQRHRPALLDADQQIRLHFMRLYGSTGEEQRDTYITDLANVQSLEGLHQGPTFCPNLKPLVLRALTLRDMDEMSRFATDNSVANPYWLATCQHRNRTRFRIRSPKSKSRS